MQQKVPRCPSCQGVVKPDITFFGEKLPAKVKRAVEADHKKVGQRSFRACLHGVSTPLTRAFAILRSRHEGPRQAGGVVGLAAWFPLDFVEGSLAPTNKPQRVFSLHRSCFVLKTLLMPNVVFDSGGCSCLVYEGHGAPRHLERVLSWWHK